MSAPSVAPAVSVVVPSYNYARYLRAALDCVLAQTFADFELLVVEDGSTDQSLKVARAVAARDDRARLLTHPDGGNHGLAAALTLGVAAARGRWTAFLEADDLWLPDCLERRLDIAETSGADIVLNDISLMPMPEAKAGWFEGYVPRVMRWHARQARAASDVLPAGPLSEEGDAARVGERATPSGRAYTAKTAFFRENKIPTFSCAMVRTDLLRRVSLVPPVPRWLDWWVWAQLAASAAFAFVPHKLTRWRLHPESWHGKVEPERYLEDYRAMGRGLRRLFTGPLIRDGRWGTAAFLWLPAGLRLAARLALPLTEDGPAATLRRVWGRLRFSGKNIPKF